MSRQRIDALLAERGLAPSRTSAAESVRAGRVRIGARRAAGAEAEPARRRRRRAAAQRRAAAFVSRGGIKLENALEALAIDVAGLDCLDVGASTGGFTDCLLARGAARVIALDVAHGQLDWGLRNDPRVTVIERRNARELDADELPYRPALATVDVSFISLAKVVPAVAGVPGAGGELLAMVKPQFELGKGRARAGVVRDPADRREALLAAADAIEDAGLGVRGVRVVGPAGAEGQPGDLRPRGRRRSSAPRPRGGDRGGRAMSEPVVDGAPEVRTAVLLTHTQPEQTAAAVGRRGRGRRGRGLPPVRARRRARASTADVGERARAARRSSRAPDLCLVLGGDGTILKALRALRAHRGAGVRGQLRHRRLPRRRSSATALDDGLARGVRRRVRGDADARARGDASTPSRRWRSTTSR